MNKDDKILQATKLIVQALEEPTKISKDELNRAFDLVKKTIDPIKPTKENIDYICDFLKERMKKNVK